jgi:hypothetical protein
MSHKSLTVRKGGASAKPTPANNAGGGSGWGDQGFIKGGTTDNKNSCPNPAFLLSVVPPLMKPWSPQPDPPPALFAGVIYMSLPHSQ